MCAAAGGAVETFGDITTVKCSHATEYTDDACISSTHELCGYSVTSGVTS